MLKLHHEGAQRVAVGGDKNALAALELRLDLLLEVRPRAGDGVLQALGVGEVLLRHVAEHRLDVRVTLVAGRERGRLDVEGTTPDEDLLLAVLLGGLGLVEALERAVVTLVEAPGLVDGQPRTVHLVKDDVQRVDGALEQRGVADVKVEALLLQCLAAGSRLRAAGVGKVDIGPTGEEVELVPLGLAVTNDHEVHVLVVSHGLPFSWAFSCASAHLWIV